MTTVAGMALALGFGAMPAVAFPGTISGTVTAESATAGSPATKNPAVGVAASTVPAVPSAGTLPSAGPSGAGLSEAVLRDLGMSLAEFNAAGELGRRAADAMNSLRVLPGFVGISLKGGRILVQGSGTALQARVDELNQPGPANFVLVPPSALNAEEALAVNLITEIHEAPELMDAANSLADRIGRQDPLALRITKSVFHAPAEAHPLIDQLAQGILFESQAKFERMQGFLDRSPARRKDQP